MTLLISKKINMKNNIKFPIIRKLTISGAKNTASGKKSNNFFLISEHDSLYLFNNKYFITLPPNEKRR